MARLLDDIRTGTLLMPWFVAPHLRAAWQAHTARVTDLLRTEMPVLLIDNVSDCEGRRRNQ